MPGIEALSGLGSALNGLGGVSALVPQGVTGVTGTSGPGTAGMFGAAGTAGTQGVSGAGGGFAATLVSQMENVQALQAKSSDLGIKAATGDLTDVHDYTIAATQAKVATEVTVAVRNKGLEAFNDIMRMQV